MITPEEVEREIDHIFAQAALPDFIRYVNEGIPFAALMAPMPAVGARAFDILLGMLEESGLVVLDLARTAAGQPVAVRPGVLLAVREPVVLERRVERPDAPPGEEAWLVSAGSARGVALLADGIVTGLRLLRPEAERAAA